MTGPARQRLSGACPWPGPCAAMVVACACALPLALVHALVSRASGLGQAALLSLFGLGYVAGIGAAKGAVLGRLRNRAVVAVAGGCAGAVGLYAAWVLWLGLCAHHLAVTPAELVAAWPIAARASAWQAVREWQPGGSSLAVLWSLEAALVVGIAAATALRRLEDRGYCEACDRWVEQTDVLKLEHVPLEEVRRLAREGALRRLAGVRWKADEPDARGWTDVTLSACPSCDDLPLARVDTFGGPCTWVDILCLRDTTRALPLTRVDRITWNALSRAAAGRRAGASGSAAAR